MDLHDDLRDVPTHHRAFARLVQQSARAHSRHAASEAEVLERFSLASRIGRPQAGESRDLTRQQLQLYVPAAEQAALQLCLLELRAGTLRVATAGALSDPEVQGLAEAVRRSQSAVERILIEPWDKARMTEYMAEHADVAADRLVRMLAILVNTPDDAGSVEVAVKCMFDDAMQCRASDIHLTHFDADADLCLISYRVDGDLDRRHVVPSRVMAPIITRIMTIGGVDSSERRRPQDGRLDHLWQGRRVDVRLSVRPIDPEGLKMVLRLLDRANLQSLDHIFKASPEIHARVRDILANPIKDGGLLLLTGPTGSGKSTTLYASAMAIDRVRRAVCSAEAPTEYLMPLVEQSSAEERPGMRMADLVRAFMRADPDIILIGELRDMDTVTAALRAVESSHFVLTTIHAIDCAHGLDRMVAFLPGQEEREWGAGLLGHSLKGVVNQRLVKRLCRACCRQGVRAGDVPGLVEAMPGHLSPSDTVSVPSPDGCKVCRNTGYVGRELVVECLFPPVSMEVRRHIVDLVRAKRSHRIASLPGVVHVPRLQSVARLVRAGLVDPATALSVLAEIDTSASETAGGAAGTAP